MKIRMQLCTAFAVAALGAAGFAGAAGRSGSATTPAAARGLYNPFTLTRAAFATPTVKVRSVRAQATPRAVVLAGARAQAVRPAYRPAVRSPFRPTARGPYDG